MSESRLWDSTEMVRILSKFVHFGRVRIEFSASNFECSLKSIRNLTRIDKIHPFQLGPIFFSKLNPKILVRIRGSTNLVDDINFWLVFECFIYVGVDRMFGLHLNSIFVVLHLNSIFVVLHLNSILVVLQLLDMVIILVANVCISTYTIFLPSIYD